jgi:hypothetical protein
LAAHVAPAPVSLTMQPNPGFAMTLTHGSGGTRSPRPSSHGIRITYSVPSAENPP